MIFPLSSIPSLEITLGNQLHPAPSSPCSHSTPPCPVTPFLVAGTLASSKVFPLKCEGNHNGKCIRHERYQWHLLDISGNYFKTKFHIEKMTWSNSLAYTTFILNLWENSLVNAFSTINFSSYYLKTNRVQYLIHILFNLKVLLWLIII